MFNTTLRRSERYLIRYRSSSASGNVFQPSQLLGLIGWGKASEFDGLANGSEVASMTDYSASAQNFSALNAAGGRPLVVLNAVNGMTSFQSVSARPGFRRTTILPPAAGTTIFWVAKNTAATGTYMQGSAYNGGSTGQSFYLSGGRFAMHHPNIYEYRSNSPDLGLGLWYVYVVQGVSGQAISVYVNGVLVTWGSAPTITAPTADVRFGTGDAGSGFGGEMTEFGFYNRVIATDERLQLESYLKTRFGI